MHIYVRSRDGMQVVVELRKHAEDQHSRQAILGLISANALSNYGVVVPLMDLKDVWHFLWCYRAGGYLSESYML